MRKSIYLGDSAYATFDGHNIWLTTGHHDLKEADFVICLEPRVMENLIKFNESIIQSTKEGNDNAITE